MVLQWFDMKLYPDSWITWTRNSTYIFVEVDICFTFKPHGFLEHKTPNCKIGWARFNLPLAINTNIFFQFQATSKYQRWTSTKTIRHLMHAYIFYNIGLSSKNCYSWTREIHMVRTMRIIVCTRRTINRSLGKPKNLLPFKVQSVIKEGRSRSVICHYSIYWSSRIIRLLSPLQQKFIPIDPWQDGPLRKYCMYNVDYLKAWT
jgi:hypothetical protein